MKIVAFIISILFALLIVYPFYRLYKNPNDTLIKYLFDWRYRALREYRQWYLQGQSHTPPDSFEFWYNSVVNDLDTGEHAKRPLYERLELCNMLVRREYVNYYFQKWETFEGKLYEAMWNDYRSGLYLSRSHEGVTALKMIPPVETSSQKDVFSEVKESNLQNQHNNDNSNVESPDNVGDECKAGDVDIDAMIMKVFPDEITKIPNAVKEIKKLVKAGMINPNTGKYIKEEYSVGYSASAMYQIARKNNIPRLENLLAPIWGEKPSTIRSRWRSDKMSDKAINKRRECLNSILDD